MRAPLFVVADGMGGAQSGEVASEMAVESFDGGIPDGDSPAEGLVRIIEDANRRIHERSRSEHAARRHGHDGHRRATSARTRSRSRTSATRAATWSATASSIRLTDDHSLVGELVERGKLTEEQAETHPQRSVITRALGPGAERPGRRRVLERQAGDLFMVCSDGLTSMVREPKLKPLLVGNERPLEELGRELIAAANAAGGRDNITVILFTLEEVDAPAGARPERRAARAPDVTDDDTREYDTFTGEAVADAAPGRQPPAGPHAPRRRGARRAARPAPPTRPRPSTAPRGTVALSAVRPRAQPIEEGHAARPAARAAAPAAPAARSRPAGCSPLGCLIGLLAAFWLATRQVYFVGVDESRGNVVTLYHGLPYDLPLGIRLYSPVRHSGVTFAERPGRAPRDVHRPQAALQGRRREPGAGARSRASIQ